MLCLVASLRPCAERPCPLCAPLQCSTDSGAEAAVTGDDVAPSISIDLYRLRTDGRVRQFHRAVGRQPLVCLGAFSATLSLGDRPVDPSYVIRGLTCVLISWFDPIALGSCRPTRELPPHVRRPSKCSR